MSKDDKKPSATVAPCQAKDFDCAPPRACELTIGHDGPHQWTDTPKVKGADKRVKQWTDPQHSTSQEHHA